jgi:hypothetical protein
MNNANDIPKGHHNMVWLFAIDLPEADLPAFTEETYDEDGDLVSWPLNEALGGLRIDHDFIEVIDTATMKDYGFRRYLTEAGGYAPEQVDADAAMLDAVTGHVLLVFSNALYDGPQVFTPQPPLRLLARYGTDMVIAPMTPLRSDSAKGVLETGGKAPKSDARIGGMVATVVLVLAGLLVWLMIRISG